MPSDWDYDADGELIVHEDECGSDYERLTPPDPKPSEGDIAACRWEDEIMRRYERLGY